MPDNSSEPKINYSTLKQLPKPQKIAVIFLFALAIFIVVFWIYQMKAQISRPFVTPDGANSENATITDYVIMLKQQDTDSDGLSDYDEIYTYKTSPYLEDSDSDGLPDRTEIIQGLNPNCPQGKVCTASDTQTSTSTEGIAAEASSSSSLIPLSSGDTEEAVLQKVLSGEADAATLRNLLIEKGADKAELDKISDEDLLNSYQEVLKNQNQTGTAQ